jgi:hypothetical protein
VLKKLLLSHPPQTIILLPVHTAVCWYRAAGALVVLAAVQLSVLGLYLPPVFKLPKPSAPPQTIISTPVHTAVCESRAEGAPVMVVAVQVSSVQTPDGSATPGSVYLVVMAAAIVTGICVSA